MDSICAYHRAAPLRTLCEVQLIDTSHQAVHHLCTALTAAAPSTVGGEGEREREGGWRGSDVDGLFTVLCVYPFYFFNFTKFYEILLLILNCFFEVRCSIDN